MSHLVKIRKGWENENLASYLLSKFSFVAQPSTIGDDIGADFYCTLFKIAEKGKDKFLLPKNSFAIQIKSDNRKINNRKINNRKINNRKINNIKIDITNKIEYLSNLELPFFVGVINQSKLKLSIFSGEYFSQFISLKTPNELVAELCDRNKIQDYYEDLGNKKFIIKFPKVAEIKADISQEDLKVKIEEISQIISISLKNIASRKNCEYIFYQYGKNEIQINAGKDSAKTFRENFIKRLAENFYNLMWIYQNKKAKFNIEEFRIYESLFLKMRRRKLLSPDYVSSIYKSLKKLLNGSSTKV